jgi:hypothetical protein
LSIKNPNKKDETVIREPEDILKEIVMLNKQDVKIIDKIVSKTLGNHSEFNF